MHETIKNLLKIEQNVKIKNGSNLNLQELLLYQKHSKINHYTLNKSQAQDY